MKRNVWVLIVGGLVALVTILLLLLCFRNHFASSSRQSSHSHAEYGESQNFTGKGEQGNGEVVVECWEKMSNAAEKGDVVAVEGLINEFRRKKTVEQKDEQRIAQMRETATRILKKFRREYLRDGLASVCLDANWTAKVNCWRRTNPEGRGYFHPWHWDENQRKEDAAGVKYRKSWVKLFEAQKKPWYRKMDDENKALVKVFRDYQVTNEYHRLIVEQQDRLRVAMTNMNMKGCSVVEYSPLFWTAYSTGHDWLRKRMDVGKRWQQKEIYVKRSELPAKKEEFDTLVDQTRSQVEELKAEINRNKFTRNNATRHYAMVTNAIYRLETADAGYMRSVIEGQMDDELMDTLLELIVGE